MTPENCQLSAGHMADCTHSRFGGHPPVRLVHARHGGECGDPALQLRAPPAIMKGL
jgi:hypothetical protein